MKKVSRGGAPKFSIGLPYFLPLLFVGLPVLNFTNPNLHMVTLLFWTYLTIVIFDELKFNFSGMGYYFVVIGEYVPLYRIYQL